MRLGFIAGIIFLVIMMGLIFGSIQNESLINEDVEKNLEAISDVRLAIVDFGWTTPIELVQAGYMYFSSFFSIVWQAFNTPFTEGGWALVTYILISPIVIPIVMMLIILIIGILQSQRP